MLLRIPKGLNVHSRALIDRERNLSLERLQALIEGHYETLEHESGYAKSPACPACASESHTKRGFDEKGRQRYLCHTCGRSFTAHSSSLLSGTKIPLETWMTFAECHIELCSLREISQKCKVSLKTAFRMRGRVLAIIKNEVARLQTTGQQIPQKLTLTIDNPTKRVTFAGKYNVKSPKAASILANIISAITVSAVTLLIANCGETSLSDRKAAPFTHALAQCKSRFLCRFRNLSTTRHMQYEAWFIWLLAVQSRALAQSDMMRLLQRAQSGNSERESITINLKAECANNMTALLTLFSSR